ncbi:hypothetical protein [Parageobacillus thermoglucosidasius]|uniref:hypothetical protein n=1 Tax=Parageobacillus thermoglucosidasius TaxID=1426 RepID=UPI001627E225|nr:hypothetical protein [Parageobacillus thermoglucosidasius]
MNAFFAVSQPILNCFIARLIARPIEKSFLSTKIIHRLLVKHLLAPVFSADRLPVLGGPALVPFTEAIVRADSFCSQSSFKKLHIASLYGSSQRIKKRRKQYFN